MRQLTLWNDDDEILNRWEAWQTAQGLSTRTIDERLATIRRLLDYTHSNPRTLTGDDIITYCAQRHLSRNSRASYHATIRAFCLWMRRAKVRADDPADDTPRPKRPRSKPRPLALEAVRATYAAANRERTRAYIALAVYAGLRVHEIAKFNGLDIDPHLGSLTILGKGGSIEVIPLHPELATLARRMPRDSYWFPAYTGSAEHVSRQAVEYAISGAMRRAGVNGTPHQLRHTYGTELLRSGADIRTVQELLRHLSLQSTQRYTDTDWDRKQAAISLLQLT